MRSAPCRQTRSWLIEQRAPPERRRRRPALVIPSPVSSAIEVRTVIGRVSAALTAFRDRAAAASAPETALPGQRPGRARRPPQVAVAPMGSLTRKRSRRLPHRQSAASQEAGNRQWPNWPRSDLRAAGPLPHRPRSGGAGDQLPGVPCAPATSRRDRYSGYGGLRWTRMPTANTGHEHDQRAHHAYDDQPDDPDAISDRAAGPEAGRQHGQLQQQCPEAGPAAGHGRRSGTVTTECSRQ